MENRAPLTGDDKPLSPATKEHAALSPHRAFVVQFRDATADTPNMFGRRVEHVVSGQAAHFDSARQLTRFIRKMLTADLCWQVEDHER